MTLPVKDIQGETLKYITGAHQETFYMFGTFSENTMNNSAACFNEFGSMIY